jgi:Glu-tRNA(Gln) amidotransferase subunit E-like FAD-binding protein
MKVLEINEGKSNFYIEGNLVSPEELSRENLFKILNDIYEMDNEDSVEIPNDTQLSEIRNPVEQEIVRQIIQKIDEFKENVENIRQSVEAHFPEK